VKSYTSYFLGIPLTQKYLKEFGQLLDDIREIDSSIETVHPQTPHITLYYLNKQYQYLLNENNKKIQPLNEILKNLTLTIGGLDYFTKDSPKVLFLDVKYPKALIYYRNKVLEILERYSASDNILPFHPHMTVGRKKTIQGQQNFKENEKEIMARLEKIRWNFKINEIIIYGVDFTKSPEYQEKLLSFPVK
jgi:2'-5' RNA ligase